MPITKLTPARLKEHLRKHFVVYAVGVVICLVLTNLLWTTTAPRVPTSQSIVIYVAAPWSNVDALEPFARDIRARLAEDTDIREVEFQNLLFTNPEQDYTSSMLLMTRLATQEGDAFLCSADCMNALLHSGVVLPLDDLVADGWLSAYGLEPWYATVADEDTGEERTLLAGLRLDSVTGLTALHAFDNQGAFLALTNYSENPEETPRAIEYLMADLAEAQNAAADGTE